VVRILGQYQLIETRVRFGQVIGSVGTPSYFEIHIAHTADRNTVAPGDEQQELTFLIVRQRFDDVPKFTG